jgi:heme exporter protein D
MDGFAGLFGFFGIMASLGIPIVMIALFVMLVTSTKRQEAILNEILLELKKKEGNKVFIEK